MATAFKSPSNVHAPESQEERKSKLAEDVAYIKAAVKFMSSHYAPEIAPAKGTVFVFSQAEAPGKIYVVFTASVLRTPEDFREGIDNVNAIVFENGKPRYDYPPADMKAGLGKSAMFEISNSMKKGEPPFFTVNISIKLDGPYAPGMMVSDGGGFGSNEFELAEAGMSKRFFYLKQAPAKK